MTFKIKLINHWINDTRNNVLKIHNIDFKIIYKYQTTQLKKFKACRFFYHA